MPTHQFFGRYFRSDLPFFIALLKSDRITKMASFPLPYAATAIILDITIVAGIAYNILHVDKYILYWLYFTLYFCISAGIEDTDQL